MTTYRVTFVRYYYQAVDVTACDADDEEKLVADARARLQPNRWEPTGDSVEIVLNGVELVEGEPLSSVGRRLSQ